MLHQYLYKNGLKGEKVLKKYQYNCTIPYNSELYPIKVQYLQNDSATLQSFLKQ